MAPPRIDPITAAIRGQKDTVLQGLRVALIKRQDEIRVPLRASTEPGTVLRLTGRLDGLDDALTLIEQAIRENQQG